MMELLPLHKLPSPIAPHPSTHLGIDADTLSRPVHIDPGLPPSCNDADTHPPSHHMNRYPPRPLPTPRLTVCPGPIVHGPPVKSIARAPVFGNAISSSETAIEAAAPVERCGRQSDGTGHGSRRRSARIWEYRRGRGISDTDEEGSVHKGQRVHDEEPSAQTGSCEASRARPPPCPHLHSPHPHSHHQTTWSDPPIQPPTLSPPIRARPGPLPHSSHV
jgi:hypothetical protein